MNRFIKLFLILTIICILLTSGCVSNNLNEQNNTNQIIQNKMIIISNSGMEIGYMFYDFDVLINTREYSDAIILCERIDAKNKYLDEEIDDMKSFVNEQSLKGNIDKDTHLYVIGWINNLKRVQSLMHESAIYLQKYAESLEKGNFSEAERYGNLANHTISEMYELNLEIDKFNSEQHDS